MKISRWIWVCIGSSLFKASCNELRRERKKRGLLMILPKDLAGDTDQDWRGWDPRPFCFWLRSHSSQWTKTPELPLPWMVVFAERYNSHLSINVLYVCFCKACKYNLIIIHKYYTGKEHGYQSLVIHCIKHIQRANILCILSAWCSVLFNGTCTLSAEPIIYAS